MQSVIETFVNFVNLNYVMNGINWNGNNIPVFLLGVTDFIEVKPGPYYQSCVTL